MGEGGGGREVGGGGGEGVGEGGRGGRSNEEVILAIILYMHTLGRGPDLSPLGRIKQ